MYLFSCRPSDSRRSQAGQGQCTPGGTVTLMDPNSQTISTPGNIFSQTFNTPGNYFYYCRPHCFSGMEGVIRVVRAPSKHRRAMRQIIQHNTT